MKRNVIVITVTDIIILCSILLSYYLKKRMGHVYYNWLMMLCIIAFVLYSLLLIIIHTKLYVFIGQFLCCVFLYLMIKLDLPDRFALLVEVPKLENKIERIKENEIKDESLTVCDDYIISDWEPGFLDYQWVLVYDKEDSLQNIVDSKKMISEGRLYILYRAKECYYLCILYR